ncbi:MAG TPA: type IV secretion system protein VirB3 [Oligoflexus sp.]|uniref:type IV secretion system protein VirB3 n=1 Tax=Oligoflexus sp. TaxID=1971216 RepID=UPI002D7FD4D7|nr:type IV secretion system protein VirB3 [Oligoflexus sp.]HET9239207.1 type IV secretion system protein VirB3 [Oligoflexus sp.]
MSALMHDLDPRDPLFKGCTRPAMIFGVPLIPLAIASGSIILVSIWTTIFFSALLFPVVLIMRQIAKSDDQQFRLLGLKMLFRTMNYNHNRSFWKASAYSPLAFKKRK